MLTVCVDNVYTSAMEASSKCSLLNSETLPACLAAAEEDAESDSLLTVGLNRVILPVAWILDARLRFVSMRKKTRRGPFDSVWN